MKRKKKPEPPKPVERVPFGFNPRSSVIKGEIAHEFGCSGPVLERSPRRPKRRWSPFGGFSEPLELNLWLNLTPATRRTSKESG